MLMQAVIIQKPTHLHDTKYDINGFYETHTAAGHSLFSLNAI